MGFGILKEFWELGINMVFFDGVELALRNLLIGWLFCVFAVLLFLELNGLFGFFFWVLWCRGSDSTAFFLWGRYNISGKDLFVVYWRGVCGLLAVYWVLLRHSFNCSFWGFFCFLNFFVCFWSCYIGIFIVSAFCVLFCWFINVRLVFFFVAAVFCNIFICFR